MIWNILFFCAWIAPLAVLIWIALKPHLQLLLTIKHDVADLQVKLDKLMSKTYN